MSCALAIDFRLPSPFRYDSTSRSLSSVGCRRWRRSVAIRCSPSHPTSIGQFRIDFLSTGRGSLQIVGQGSAQINIQPYVCGLNEGPDRKLLRRIRRARGGVLPDHGVAVLLRSENGHTLRKTKACRLARCRRWAELMKVLGFQSFRNVHPSGTRHWPLPEPRPARTATRILTLRRDRRP